jgi:hypothetical protein
VHAAGIEFDDAFFVGKPAEADAGVIGIVLGSLDQAECGIQRASAAREEVVSVIDVVEAVAG